MCNDLTVIIPTLGIRDEGLIRAINSCVNQNNTRISILLVFNGDRYSQNSFEYYSKIENLSVLESDDIGVSKARSFALKFIDTKYFMFLDDDDEFIPNSLHIPLALLEEDLQLDVLVFNGFKQNIKNNTYDVCFSKFNIKCHDLEKQLIEENWLASAGAIYRNATVAHEIFSNLPDYLELTVIASRIARECNIKLTSDKLFKINTNSNERSSRSLSYFKKQPEVLKLIQSETNNVEFKALLNEKISAAWHELSDLALNEGEMTLAWKAHFKSLNSLKSFLKFILYTRTLILTN
jgi:glycosyltransferase involved in cell wall biosynthesis